MANRGRGYVKAYRCIDEHPVWTQSSEAVLKVFMACLFKAGREPVSWFDGLRQVELPNGSFLTCLADMIEYSHLTPKQVRLGLAKLVDLEIIEKRARSGAGSRMAITVLNWDSWQGSRDGPGQIIGQDRGRIGAGFENLPPGGKEYILNSPPPEKTRTRRGEGEAPAAANENGKPTPGQFDFEVWFEVLYSRHPKKGQRQIAQQYLSEVVLAVSPAEIDRVHRLWCETEDWQWKGGVKAGLLAQWVQDKGWLYPPPTQPKGAEQSWLEKRQAKRGSSGAA